MAQQTINVGAGANDGTGDDLRPAGIKINSNFTELYTSIDALADVASSGSYSDLTGVPAFVTVSGSPTVGQMAVFTSATVIEGADAGDGSLPIAGDTRDVLSKVTDGNFDVEWVSPADVSFGPYYVESLSALEEGGRLHLSAIASSPGTKYMVITNPGDVIPGEAYIPSIVSTDDDAIFVTLEQPEELELEFNFGYSVINYDEETDTLSPGVVYAATEAEILAGVNTTAVVTPFGLAEAGILPGTPELGDIEFWEDANADQSSRLIGSEDTDNGVNTGILAWPTAITSNRTWTLPDASGTFALETATLTDLLAAWTVASGSSATALVGSEDTDNGASTATLQWPAALGSNIVVTLPVTTGTLLNSSAALLSIEAQWQPASASGAAALWLLEDTDNGAHKTILQGPASIAADITLTLPGATGTILSTASTATLTVGFNATEFDAGTKSSGTYTPAPSDGNFQKAVNGGAHTLAPPASTCNIVVQYTNNGSAGAITTSGFTRVVGDPFTTTNGDDFMCFIVRNNSFSTLNIMALQ